MPANDFHPSTPSSMRESFNELQSLLRDHTANTFKRKLETAVAEDTRLFRTSHHHLGLGRPSMQPHDELWILARAPTPYLLRKIEGRDGRYIIVGDCYVRGIMHGEAVRDQQKWEKILIE
jgi:hypothetical protein